MKAEALLFVVALAGLFAGAWSAMRSEKRATERLRDEILGAIERADAASETHIHIADALAGARELERRVREFRIRTGRPVQ